MIASDAHPVPVTARRVILTLLAGLFLLLSVAGPVGAQVDGGSTGIPDSEPAIELDEDEAAVDREAVDAERRRMALIVGGLVAVAFALLLLTIRYWKTTRPVPPDAATGGDGRPERIRFGRRSRRAIAGADHAGVDDGWEPRSTGEQIAISETTARSRPRPSRTIRDEMLGSDS